LGGVLDADGDGVGTDGLKSDYEITFISGFTETIISQTSDTSVSAGADGGFGTGGDDVYTVKTTIQLAGADVGDQNVNFFQVYYDDLTDGSGLKSSSLEGTGFGDGVLILDATVGLVSGNFTSTLQFVDKDNSGDFSFGDTLLTVALDNSGNGDQWSGQQTLPGEGATALQADVFYQNYDFFKDDISSMVADLFFNTSNVLPFGETNPSRLFDIGDGAGATLAPTLGAVNGLTGPDILFQTDANNSFVKTVTVPEPGSMFLLGMGLLTLGMARRRRSGDSVQA